MPKCHTHLALHETTQTFISLVCKSSGGLQQLLCVIPMLAGVQGALKPLLRYGLLSSAGSLLTQRHPAPYRKGNCSITSFPIKKAKCAPCVAREVVWFPAVSFPFTTGSWRTQLGALQVTVPKFTFIRSNSIWCSFTTSRLESWRQIS